MPDTTLSPEALAEHRRRMDALNAVIRQQTIRRREAQKAEWMARGCPEPEQKSEPMAGVFRVRIG